MDTQPKYMDTKMLHPHMTVKYVIPKLQALISRHNSLFCEAFPPDFGSCRRDLPPFSYKSISESSSSTPNWEKDFFVCFFVVMRQETRVFPELLPYVCITLNITSHVVLIFCNICEWKQYGYQLQSWQMNNKSFKLNCNLSMPSGQII